MKNDPWRSLGKRRSACNNNDLEEGLGECCRIDLQGVSEAPPKPNAIGDPAKRSPGAEGTATGAQENRKTSHRTPSKRQSIAQEARRNIALYDGLTRLGSITGTAGKFAAVMADGDRLGNFETLKQASAAISAAKGGAR